MSRAIRQRGDVSSSRSLLNEPGEEHAIGACFRIADGIEYRLCRSLSRNYNDRCPEGSEQYPNLMR